MKQKSAHALFHIKKLAYPLNNHSLFHHEKKWFPPNQKQIAQNHFFLHSQRVSFVHYTLKFSRLTLQMRRFPFDHTFVPFNSTDSFSHDILSLSTASIPFRPHICPFQQKIPPSNRWRDFKYLFCEFFSGKDYKNPAC